MYTSIDKALVALVMAVLYLLNAFFGVQLNIPAEAISTVIPVLTPLLVWLVPNKAKT